LRTLARLTQATKAQAWTRPEPRIDLASTQDEWGKRSGLMFKDKSWQFENMYELQESQKNNRTSIGVVTPREITKSA
jgi:hypothetical protein